MPTKDNNLAYDALLTDYTRYHFVFVLLGGLATTALAVLCIVLWSRFRRVRSDGGRRFERKVYLGLAILTSLFAAFMALAFAANLSTTLRPEPGLDALISGSRSSSERREVVDAWLRAGTAEVPTPIEEAIQHRLNWQAPKAVVSALLLVGVALVAVRTWSTLVRRSTTATFTTTSHAGLLASGVTTTLASLVLLVMAVANTQASLAPLAITALGASG